jgi:hypothetical protein
MALHSLLADQVDSVALVAEIDLILLDAEEHHLDVKMMDDDQH